LIARGQQVLQARHLRFRKRDAGAGVLHCFLVDCSGSMLTGGGLARTGRLLLQMLRAAYQQRAEVALVSFAGLQATTHLRPTVAFPPDSRTVRGWLSGIDAGGGTPFAQGMDRANTLLAQAQQKWPEQQRWLWVLTDGRSRERPAPPLHVDECVVVDCESQRVALGRCRELAREWNAGYRSLEEE
jgi:magnesium chelatase subunit ChlD-like protein